jgi:LacI family repressor for deo operon, udp, cdd, tsx, nupC, and nupG
VKIDNREAAAMAVNHLADLGHRRIGHVAGPPGNVLTEARQAGWQEACIARGLTPDPALLYPGDFGLDSGQRAARLWLDQPPATRPTAVFLASDEMACGFIGEVLRHGIRVPQDLSVVGFDDIELVAHIAPPLTTIRQPRNELGRIAAERLLARLEGRADDTDTVLPVELVLRGSTAPPGG